MKNMKATLSAIPLLLVGAAHGDVGGIRGTERQLQTEFLTLGVPTRNALPEENATVPPTTIPPTTIPPIPATINATNDEYDVMEGHQLRKRGVLDNDQSSVGDMFVSEIYEEDSFQGSLRVKDNGEVRYTPDDNFLGTETFIYTACLEDYPLVCDNATVTINVNEDPNKPNEPPRAYDKEYEVYEGETLEVFAPGFLGNDQSGSPYNPLRICDSNSRRSDSIEGEIDMYEDGSFEYEARRCWTGTETITYRACYEDYRDMASNMAALRIRVRENPYRPDRPNADDKRFTVYEGETLRVDEWDGLLKNDDRYRVRSIDKRGDFVGDLDVDYSDGNFEYTAISGKLGTFEFSYEVCVDDWECVGCDEGTVRIEVQRNPDKPNTAPLQVSRNNNNLLELSPGERIRSSVADMLDYDSRYNLRVSNYRTGIDFRGILNTDSDGNFEFGNSPIGESTFTFSVCYREWPDLCSDGFVTLTTRQDESLERTNIPTLEDVGNDGEPIEKFPLAECQSDCDDDEECQNGLICMSRTGTEVVPGCAGDGIHKFSGRDFCILPPEVPMLVVVGDADGSSHPSYPLSECEADCDSDSECKDGLICFHRSGMESVPGCDGDQASFRGKDFCIQPPGILASRNGG